jgi:hypothetical protein
VGEAAVSSLGRQRLPINFPGLKIEERCSVGHSRHRCGSRAGYSASLTGELDGAVGAASRESTLQDSTAAKKL